MASELQKLKNDIWYAKQALEKQQNQYQEWVNQYNQVRDILEANPQDEVAAAMLPEIQQGMLTEEANLVPLREHLEALQAQLPQKPAEPARKFDPEQHPVLKKTLDKAEPEKTVVFNTGDVVEARWERDGHWYKAKILTILGSSSAPKYHVSFVEYDDTATVDRDAVRPIHNKRKREPEPTPASAPAAAPPVTPAPVTSTPHVISGPASLNPKAQAAKQPPPPVNTDPVKKRHIPNSKRLDKAVSSWKDWQSKGVGKKHAQKDSMFRTNTNVNSRVGFTGSGKGMTETTKRVRYDNKAAAAADGDRD